MTELSHVLGDPEVCTGCMICVNVCSMFYFKVIGPEWARARVIRLENGLDFPLFCRNCEDAPCMAACPVGAITRTSKGILVVNNRKCDSCGACVTACPYDAIHLTPDTRKAVKCIQCGECVKRCPVHAIFLTSAADLSKRDPEGRLMRLHDRHSAELYDGGERL
ncbi:MAG: 4Fe-4S dicluster domain-containing protein [Candidatus Thorarchaeota archaeon]|nr:4Fe-4S dicluster domain-containing protein [Candidatus Thorarchaeota archaeon]